MTKTIDRGQFSVRESESSDSYLNRTLEVSFGDYFSSPQMSEIWELPEYAVVLGDWTYFTGPDGHLWSIRTEHSRLAHYAHNHMIRLVREFSDEKGEPVTLSDLMDNENWDRHATYARYVCKLLADLAASTLAYRSENNVF